MKVTVSPAKIDATISTKPISVKVSSAGPTTADRVGYTPAVPGDWSPVPTKVSQALDEIAAGGIGGGGALPFKTVGLTTGDYKVSNYASPQAAIQAASDALTDGGTIWLLDRIECTDATHDVGGGTQYAAVVLGDYVNINCEAGLSWADGASATFTHQGANANYLLAPGTFSRINGKLWGHGNYTCPIRGIATCDASGTNTLGSALIVTRRRVNLGVVHIEGFAENGLVTNNNDTPAVQALGWQGSELRIKACGGTGLLHHAWATDCELDELWVGSCHRNIDILAPEFRVRVIHSWGAAEYPLVFDGVNGSNIQIAQAYIESNAKGIFYNGCQYVHMGTVELRANGLDGVSNAIKCVDAPYNSIGKLLALNNIGVQIAQTGKSHHNDWNVDFRDEYAATAEKSAITHAVSIAAGDTLVTFTGDAPLIVDAAQLPSKHVGCWLVIPGAGAAGATLTSARIASVQDTSHCTLDTPASTAVTNANAVLHSIYADVWEGTNATTFDANAAPNTYRGSSSLFEVVNSQLAINPASQVIGMIGVGTARPTKVVATSGSAYAWNWRDGQDTLDLTLDQATVTLSLFGPSPIVIGTELTFVLRQDGSGGRTVVWPSNVRFASGTLTLSTTAGAVDQVRVRYGGTNWRELSRSIQDAASGGTVTSVGSTTTALVVATPTTTPSLSIADAVAGGASGLLSGADKTKLNATSGANTGDQDLSSYATTAAVAAGYQPIDSDLTAIAALSTTTFGRSILAMADAATVKTALSLVKGDVGLGNVDNTSDASKPVSTAQAAADAASVATAEAYAVQRANHTGTQPLSSLAAQADQSIVGNVSGGSASPIALTANQVATMLNLAALQVQFSGINVYRRSLDKIRGGNGRANGVLQANIDNSPGTTTVTVDTNNLTRTGVSELIKIDSEEMFVTAGQNTTSLTVTRAVNGTTIASHTAGAPILVSRIKNIVCLGDSTCQSTDSAATGRWESWPERLRRIVGARFGGDLGIGFQGIWHCGSGIAPLTNSLTDWALSGSWGKASGSVNWDFGFFQYAVSGAASTAITSVTTTDAGDVFTKTAHGLTNGSMVFLSSIVSTTGIATATTYYVISATANTFQLSLTVGGSAVALTTDGSCTVTQQAYAAWTRPAGVTVAQIDVYWVDIATGGSWSYSTDGGTTWVAHPNTQTNPTAELKKSSIVVTNPTDFRVRAASAANAASITELVGIDVWSTVPVFGVTQGVKVHNCGCDGELLAMLTRSYACLDAVTSNGSPTLTSVLAGSSALNHFSSTMVGALVTGTNIPANTYVGVVNSNSSIGLSSSASSNVPVNATGATGIVYIDGSAGDWARMLDGNAASIVPDLVTAGPFTNDYNPAARGTGATAGDTNAYTHQLGIIYDRVSPYADVLYIAGWEQGGTRLDGTQTTAAFQLGFRTALESVASTKHGASINFYTAWSAEGNTGYAAANADGLMNSTLHVGKVGIREVAGRLSRLLETF